MKTRRDPRHLIRRQIVQELFGYSFNEAKGVELGKQAKKVVVKIKKIDPLVAKSAFSRPIGEINRIDLSILRLAIFELVYQKKTPFRVVVDEAVELAKEFGSESSPSFVNGVLGHLISSHDTRSDTMKS